MSKKPGLNLADLAPMTIDVPVGPAERGDYLTVHGISAKEGLVIFQRFPKIAGMVSEGFNLGAFLSVAPDAVAAVIAAASGKPDDPDAEEGASGLPLETQWDILEAIGGLTFTNGFAPFAKRIMALAGGQGSAPFTKVPATKSQQPSKPSAPPDTLL